MSVLKKVFNVKKKKKESTKSTEDAIQDLRLTEEIMANKQKIFEKIIENEAEIAKQNATTNKRVALKALKRKKLYEQKLSQIDNTLLTMEQQREALEGANINMNTLNILKDSAGTLKLAHKQMTTDDIHEIMDDVSEVLGTSEEISKVISRPITLNNDEDELQKELEELIRDSKLNEQLKIETTTVTNLSLPIVPTFEPNTQSKTKPKTDDEINKLADWAS